MKCGLHKRVRGSLNADFSPLFDGVERQDNAAFTNVSTAHNNRQLAAPYARSKSGTSNTMKGKNNTSRASSYARCFYPNVHTTHVAYSIYANTVSQPTKAATRKQREDEGLAWHHKTRLGGERWISPYCSA